MTDVAVVGASAAGLYLAGSLADRSVDVAVFERAATLRPEPRTLVVTSAVRAMLGPVLDSSLRGEITRYELMANGTTAEIALAEPDLVIERAALIDELSGRVRDAGVPLHLGHRFAALRGNGHGCAVAFDYGGTELREITASAVVAADGANTAVARAAGWPKQQTVPIVQAVIRRPADLDPCTTRVWFRPHETPYFYWLIPDSDGGAVLGLIGGDAAAARGHLDAFLAEKGYHPCTYQAARIPRYGSWTTPMRPLGSGRVFVVGDAAGHVKVTTVGGIHTGFVGARAVADLVASGSRRGLRALRRELGRHMLVRRALDSFGEDEYSRLLTLLGRGERGLLARHNRDDTGKLLWRLSAREPRLVLLALRGLLTGERYSSAGTRSTSAARKPPTATIQPMSM